MTRHCNISASTKDINDRKTLSERNSSLHMDILPHANRCFYHEGLKQRVTFRGVANSEGLLYIECSTKSVSSPAENRLTSRWSKHNGCTSCSYKSRKSLHYNTILGHKERCLKKILLWVSRRVVETRITHRVVIADYWIYIGNICLPN